MSDHAPPRCQHLQPHREWTADTVALNMAQDTPNRVIPRAVLIAVAAGVTYEELSQETGWTVERLQVRSKPTQQSRRPTVAQSAPLEPTLLHHPRPVTDAGPSNPHTIRSGIFGGSTERFSTAEEKSCHHVLEVLLTRGLEKSRRLPGKHHNRLPVKFPVSPS